MRRARLEIAPSARVDLEELVHRLGLPASTPIRIRRQLDTLRLFPERGRALAGPWTGYRIILGPWPWLILVYAYDKDRSFISVVAIEDARTGRSATSQG